MSHKFAWLEEWSDPFNGPCDTRTSRGAIVGLGFGALIGAAEAYARERPSDLVSVNTQSSFYNTLSLMGRRAGAFAVGVSAFCGSLCFFGSLHDSKLRSTDFALSGVLSGFLLSLCVGPPRVKHSITKGLQLGFICWLYGLQYPSPNLTLVENRARFHSQELTEYLQDKERKQQEQGQ